MVETALLNNSALPVELTVVMLMEAMGWSWQELMATPAFVVADAITLLQKRGVVAEMKRGRDR